MIRGALEGSIRLSFLFYHPLSSLLGFFVLADWIVWNYWLRGIHCSKKSVSYLMFDFFFFFKLCSSLLVSCS
ncbi:hypothetical protein BJX99DRAFT_155261 [Aspergillus californicus]